MTGRNKYASRGHTSPRRHSFSKELTKMKAVVVMSYPWPASKSKQCDKGQNCKALVKNVKLISGNRSRLGPGITGHFINSYINYGIF